MTKPHLPEEPKFIKSFTSIQKIFSSVALSMIFIVWISGRDFIIDIFKPDFVFILTFLRIGLASFALLITAFVGGEQIVYMLRRVGDMYESYKKIAQYKKQKEEDT